MNQSESEYERLSRELREANERYNRLLEEKNFFESVAGADSLDAVIHLVLEYINRQWGFESFTVQLVDEEAKRLNYFTSYGVPLDDPDVLVAVTRNMQLDNKESISTYVARKQKIYYATDINPDVYTDISDVDLKALKTLNIKDNLILPVIYKSRTVGVIHMFTNTKALGLNAGQISLIQQFVQSLAKVIEMEKRMQKLQKT